MTIYYGTLIAVVCLAAGFTFGFITGCNFQEKLLLPIIETHKKYQQEWFDKYMELLRKNRQ